MISRTLRSLWSGFLGSFNIGVRFNRGSNTLLQNQDTVRPRPVRQRQLPRAMTGAGRSKNDPHQKVPGGWLMVADVS